MLISLEKLKGQVASKSLNDILTHLDFVHQLQKTLAPLLPTEWRSLYKVIRYRDQQLVISAQNAEIATRLRFTQEDIISLLRTECPSLLVQSIVVIIEPNQFNNP